MHRGFTFLYDLHFGCTCLYDLRPRAEDYNCCSPSLSAVLFSSCSRPYSTVEQRRVPLPLAKRVAELVFPLVVHAPKSLELT